MVTTETNYRILDAVPVGDLVIEFVSAEQTDTPGSATTLRRYLMGSRTNLAPRPSRLGGASAVIPRTDIGAFGEFLKSLLGRNAPYRRAETPVKQRA